MSVPSYVAAVTLPEDNQPEGERACRRGKSLMLTSTLLRARFPAAGVGRLGTASAGPVSEMSAKQMKTQYRRWCRERWQVQSIVSRRWETEQAHRYGVGAPSHERIPVPFPSWPSQRSRNHCRRLSGRGRNQSRKVGSTKLPSCEIVGAVPLLQQVVDVDLVHAILPARQRWMTYI